MTCSDCDCGKSEVDATVDANPLDEEIKIDDPVMRTYSALWQLSERNRKKMNIYFCNTTNGHITHTPPLANGVCQCGETRGDVTTKHTIGGMNVKFSNEMSSIVYRPPPEPVFYTDSGVKFDKGKTQLSILTKESLTAEAQALSYGANKYGRDNYKKGMDWSRVLDACMRHLVAFNSKEDNDAESGLSHLAHAKANLAMLIYYAENKVGKDDR